MIGPIGLKGSSAAAVLARQRMTAMSRSSRSMFTSLRFPAGPIEVNWVSPGVTVPARPQSDSFYLLRLNTSRIRFRRSLKNA
ncbi:hypothetical protein PDIDSM_3057 [Penicillium digitatum]|nr:hypothetical protein PDIDSM_3057 [Penicillium digitatum]